MTQESGGMVSAVAEVQAPDGSTFGMLRWAGDNAAQIRGQALVQMREQVAAREPESLQFLETHAGISAEYATSAAIGHVNDKGLKADLVRIAIKRELAEGFREGAIRMLAYSNAAELELPEYGEQFAHDQYHAAMEEGNYRDAYMLAGTMRREGRKAMKIESPPSDLADKGVTAWKEREETAFKLYARQVLDAYGAGTIMPDDWRLRGIFDSYRFRQDGYNGSYIDPLATEVAKAMVDAELKRGRGWVALQDAITAQLPDEFVNELRKNVSPDETGKFKRWANEVRERLSRVFHEE